MGKGKRISVRDAGSFLGVASERETERGKSPAALDLPIPFSFPPTHFYLQNRSLPRRAGYAGERTNINDIFVCRLHPAKQRRERQLHR